jgi:hypothetical protein
MFQTLFSQEIQNQKSYIPVLDFKLLRQTLNSKIIKVAGMK